MRTDTLRDRASNRSIGIVVVRSILAVLTIGCAGAAATRADSPAGEGDVPIAAIPFESVPEGTRAVSNPIVLESDVVVSGEVKSEGVYQQGNSAPVPFESESGRYIVEAGTPLAGTVVPLDHVRVQALCRDLDGCEVVIAMINWDGTQNAASLRIRLFLSQAADTWRTAEFIPVEGSTQINVTGEDDDDASSEVEAWDCHFTDGETPGGGNVYNDSGPGFGLLNEADGFPDGTTVCRVVLID